MFRSLYQAENRLQLSQLLRRWRSASSPKSTPYADPLSICYAECSYTRRDGRRRRALPPGSPSLDLTNMSVSIRSTPISARRTVEMPFSTSDCLYRRGVTSPWGGAGCRIFPFGGGGVDGDISVGMMRPKRHRKGRTSEGISRELHVADVLGRPKHAQGRLMRVSSGHIGVALESLSSRASAPPSLPIAPAKAKSASEPVG